MKKLMFLCLMVMVCLVANADTTKVLSSDKTPEQIKAQAKLDSIAAAKKTVSTATPCCNCATPTNNPGIPGTGGSKPVAPVQCKPAPFGTYPAVGYFVILLFVISFWVIAARTDLLRESIVNPEDFLAEAKKMAKYKDVTSIHEVKKAFSLSRSQLGAWTLVISCSYIYLELCRYTPMPAMTLDKTLLALMGISAGTTAVSNVIDNNDPVGAAPVKQYPSEGFLKDILSDQNGINLHRFQNVLWTFTAITLYLCQVPEAACGHMPVLDTTIVGLTGISSATYLGLKVNENKPAAIPPAAPPAGAPPPTPPAVPPSPQANPI